VHGYAQRLVGAFDRRQGEAGMPRAKDDRRHHHMQSIEATGGKKSRYRDSAPFNQNPAKPVTGQSGKDCRGSDLPVTCRQRDCFNARWRRASRALRNDQQAARAIGSKHFRVTAQPAFGINDHTRWVRSRHTPHGELRIVGDGRANAYDYTVDQRPQTMQMGKARRSIDIFRMPGLGRNPPIERLPDLADHHQIVHFALSQWAKDGAPSRLKP
jgi:hypothetical protein